MNDQLTVTVTMTGPERAQSNVQLKAVITPADLAMLIGKAMGAATSLANHFAAEFEKRNPRKAHEFLKLVSAHIAAELKSGMQSGMIGHVELEEQGGPQ